MAYARIIDELCSTSPMAFQKIRDFICKRIGTYNYSTTGIGWTLWDSIYAVNEGTLTDGDYFVIFSPGESGRDQMYVKFTYKTTYLTAAFYLYWNKVSHTGFKSITTPPNFSFQAALKLCIFGDLDSFVFFDNWTTVYPSMIVGKLQTFDSTVVSETILISSSVLTAGVDRSIIFTETLPTDWAVSKYVFIWDNANIERVLIKTINAGTKTITADVINPYPSGCKGSRFVGYIQLGGSNTIYTSINRNGTLNAAVDLISTENFKTQCDGDKWIISDIYVLNINGIEGKLRNVRTYSFTAPIIKGDTLIDQFSVSWRCFYHLNFDGLAILAYREV